MTRWLALVVLGLLVALATVTQAQDPNASSSVELVDLPDDPVEVAPDQPTRISTDVVLTVRNVTCYEEGFASVAFGSQDRSEFTRSIFDPGGLVFRIPPGVYTGDASTGAYRGQANTTLLVKATGRVTEPRTTAVDLGAEFDGLESGCTPEIPPASSNHTIEVRRLPGDGSGTGGGGSAGDGDDGGTDDSAVPLGPLVAVAALLTAARLRRRIG